MTYDKWPGGRIPYVLSQRYGKPMRAVADHPNALRSTSRCSSTRKGNLSARFSIISREDVHTVCTSQRREGLLVHWQNRRVCPFSYEYTPPRTATDRSPFPDNADVSRMWAEPAVDKKCHSTMGALNTILPYTNLCTLWDFGTSTRDGIEMITFPFYGKILTGVSPFMAMRVVTRDPNGRRDLLLQMHTTNSVKSTSSKVTTTAKRTTTSPLCITIANRLARTVETRSNPNSRV